MPHVREQQNVANHLDSVADEEANGRAGVVGCLGGDDNERACEVTKAVGCAVMRRRRVLVMGL